MAGKRGSGRYGHRVTLQSPTNTGPTLATRRGVTQTWTNYQVVSARVETMSARERTMLSGMLGEATHSVSMRYNTLIESGHRLLFNGRILTVLGPPIDVDGAHGETQLTCKENV